MVKSLTFLVIIGCSEQKSNNPTDEVKEEKIMDTYIKINGELRACDFKSNWFKN